MNDRQRITFAVTPFEDLGETEEDVGRVAVTGARTRIRPRRRFRAAASIASEPLPTV